MVDEKLQSALEKILILLRTRTSHDFSAYKKNTLYRRIERRMGIHQIDKIAAYVRYLRETPQELDLLFKEFLIGVTSFFRDPLAWQVLREETLPALIANRPGGLLRAWVAGCSTGEEAYSLAIAFKEAMEKTKTGKNFKLQIFATDLDPDAIDKARCGIFSENVTTDVSPGQLRRFFTKEGRGYRVRTEIREMVIFSPQSLIMDPPFTRLDLLSCRNLLIYLSPEMQKKLFPLFHYSLFTPPNSEIKWANRAMWAPSVIRKDGKYFLFFGANDIQNDQHPGGIGIAVADQPQGPCMFIRNKKYYFMWSEGGWTGPDYCVAYAIADSPFGPFKRIAKVLQQDPQIATGAGHHSVIQVPGTDGWFAVYHRRPLTETDQNSRVTCIEEMHFDDKGLIQPRRIATEGVQSLKIERTLASESARRVHPQDQVCFLKSLAGTSRFFIMRQINIRRPSPPKFSPTSQVRWRTAN